MAWTQDDLTKVRAAIASGVQSVRYSDGRQVNYQSLADLLAAEKEIRAQLAADASQVSPRVRYTVGRMRWR